MELVKEREEEAMEGKREKVGEREIEFSYLEKCVKWVI